MLFLVVSNVNEKHRFPINQSMNMNSVYFWFDCCAIYNRMEADGFMQNCTIYITDLYFGSVFHFTSLLYRWAFIVIKKDSRTNIKSLKFIRLILVTCDTFGYIPWQKSRFHTFPFEKPWMHKKQTEKKKWRRELNVWQ